ncbi:hypothetical protein [Helicobacter bilis]|uniref:hypothetical protein n=1 Tax=Helicobacter bilis TaxID=37372 RepID=UPI00051D1A97|nr:hypothetical protein [Helicobacter bilis]
MGFGLGIEWIAWIQGRQGILCGIWQMHLFYRYLYLPPPPVNITALCYFCNIFIYGIDMLEFWGIFIKGFEWLYNIIMAKIAF